MKTSCTVLLIALFCTFSGHQELNAQHDKTVQDLSRFIDLTVKDPVYIAQEMNQKDLGLLFAAGVTIAGISTFDRRSSTYFQSRFRNSPFLDAVNEVGNFHYIAPISAALFGTSLLSDNHKFQDAAFTSLQSVLYIYLC